MTGEVTWYLVTITAPWGHGYLGVTEGIQLSNPKIVFGPQPITVAGKHLDRLKAEFPDMVATLVLPI